MICRDREQQAVSAACNKVAVALAVRAAMRAHRRGKAIAFPDGRRP